jgi:hypothetical protein
MANKSYWDDGLLMGWHVDVCGLNAALTIFDVLIFLAGMVGAPVHLHCLGMAGVASGTAGRFFRGSR